MSCEQLFLLTATYNCGFTEWGYLCSGRDWNSVNTFIRLIFWETVSNIFCQRLKQDLFLKLSYFSQKFEYSRWAIRSFAECMFSRYFWFFRATPMLNFLIDRRTLSRAVPLNHTFIWHTVSHVEATVRISGRRMYNFTAIGPVAVMHWKKKTCTQIDS